MCETTIGGLFRVDARESTEIVSGEGGILGFFLVWLSDLHIGRIIVLEGANLDQFENEPAVLALPLAMKGGKTWARR